MAAALIDQSRNFFTRLSTLQKILLFVVPVAVIAGIFFLFISGSRPEMSVLFSSLEPRDASKIVEVLKAQNIEYELGDNGTSISIPKDKLYETRLNLASQGLPETSVVGYEIFDKTNLGMSEFIQKLNYRRALEGELARTIGSLQEVKKARVHIVIPEKALFEKDQQQPTASVTLAMNSGRSISKVSIDGIQNLVASSIEGMKPVNVTVVDNRGKILNEPPLDATSVAGLTASQYEQQQKVEAYLSGKVQSMLNGVLGSGNSEVRVNADLDFTQIEKTITDYDPERQIERSAQTIEENSQTTDSLNFPYVNSAKNQSNSITNYEISKTEEKIVQGVGNIKRLSVAALINGTLKIADKNGVKSLEYLPRNEDEMQKLTEIIKNSIGYDPSRNDQVSVINVPFDTRIQEEDISDLTPVPWWKNPEIQKLILLGVAILITVFVMFRLLHSKEIKDRLRIAMALPEHGSLDESGRDDMEELRIGDDDLLLLPADLPEQLLIEGEHRDGDMERGEIDGEEMMDRASLAEKARAKLEGTPELTENAMMKIEIKNKVQSYINSETDQALRLFRVFLSQDAEEKVFRA